jgi:hypothetical protein
MAEAQKDKLEELRLVNQAAAEKVVLRKAQILQKRILKSL